MPSFFDRPIQIAEKRFYGCILRRVFGEAFALRDKKCAVLLCVEATEIFDTRGVHLALPNVQDEPRPWLARLVLLGARDVTAMVVGSGAWFGFFFIVSPTDARDTCRLCMTSYRNLSSQIASCCGILKAARLRSEKHQCA